MILLLDTAKETCFIGIWDGLWVCQESFTGGRELNKLIIQKLKKVLAEAKANDHNNALSGIIVNAGPGSFTGLRIGLSVANTIAYTEDIPIVGVKNSDDIDKILLEGEALLKSAAPGFSSSIIPYYGAEPNITSPKI